MITLHVSWILGSSEERVVVNYEILEDENLFYAVYNSSLKGAINGTYIIT